MSGFSEAVSGGLTGADDNFSFLLRYSNPGKAAGFLFSWQPTTGYSLRIDKWGRLTTWDEERREWTLRSEWAAVVSLLVVEDQRRAVCSPSCSLTCTTCEAGLQRTTPSRLLSLINFKQTQRPGTAIQALNSRINAYFQPSVNKGRKALAGKARRTAAAARSAQNRDKKQSPYENNNTVTCKQGENMSPHPSSQSGQKSH